jgi:enoyl-CoA hydratase/carnithine racemase
MAEVGFGLVPDLGGTGRLATLVGRQRALEISAVGREVTGEEAARVELAVRCVPDAALSETVSTLVADLIRQPAPPLRAVVQLVRAAGTDSADQQLARERAAQVPLLRDLVAGAPRGSTGRAR